MKRQILKYRLPVKNGDHAIKLPIGISILSLQVQNNEPVLYGEVEVLSDEDLNDKDFYEMCVFRILNTGEVYEENQCDEHSEFIGTVMLDEGSYVLHVIQIFKRRTK